MSRRLAVASVLLVCSAALAGPEVLVGVRFRAVTIPFEENRSFKIPGVERITAASGACLEESLDVEETQTLIITAACEGVRTSMVWLKHGTRIHMLACAEARDPNPELKKLRSKLQVELKAWKSATACVKNGRVELWGWVEKQEDKDKIAALALKHGDKVLDKVEYVEP